MGIKAKILIPTIVLTLLVAAAVLSSNIVLFSRFVDKSTDNRVLSASKIALHHLDDLNTKAVSAALNMAENSSIVSALMENSRSQLLIHAKQIQERAGVEFCTIADRKGIVVLRTHDPERRGDSIAQQENIRSAMAGKTLVSLEEGPVIRLAVRADTPIFDRQGGVAGVVSVGYRLDEEQYVDSIKDISGCETTVFLGGERISTTVLLEDGSRALGTTANPEIIERVLAGEPYTGEADVLGRAAIASYMPLNAPDGRTIGMLFVGHYVDEMNETIHAFVQSGLSITLITLAIFAAVILVIAQRIIAPIYTMARTASALAVGDTEVDPQVNTKDEMRTLADAFRSMVENTRMQVHIVEQIASGVLTDSLRVRSEKDLMNRALGRLNETIRAQAASIREEHERVRLMLDATPLACRLWSRDFELLDCNEAAVKLFHLGDKQEYMDRYFDLSPQFQPDGQSTVEKIRQSVSEAFEKGACVYDWMYRLSDGTPLPSENTLVRVPYGDDYVVAAYSRDLRAQNRMMAEIERRDTLLNICNSTAFILFDTAGDNNLEAILMGSMEFLGDGAGVDRIHIMQNESVEGALHFTCKYTWVSGPDRAERAIAPGESFSYAIDPDWKNYFLQGKCLNGPIDGFSPATREFFASQDLKSVLAIPVFVQEQFWGLVGFGDGGQERTFMEDEVSILRSVSLMMAIAVNRDAQATHIREAHLRTRLLMNATPLAFNLWDRELRNIETNETAAKLFGLPSQQEYLRRFLELSPKYQPDGRQSDERTLELLGETFEEGYRQFEWLHQSPDGTLIPAEITLVRLAYGGGHVVAGYIRDLREYKKMMADIRDASAQLETALEAARNANSAKSSFLAQMSHEIRTPLNAVIGLSELTLGGEDLGREAETNLEKIYAAGSTILSIVNDILDISKIESGKFELYPVQYDTPSLINDVVTLNIVRIGEKPITFQLDADENLPASLFGDDLRVKQIFNNLLSNAFKYTDAGVVEWRVSFEREGDDVWLVSSVRDTGIGITPENVQKLFSDYNQVDAKTNRKVEGTGLGLAITKRFAEMMDGSVTVESEYGKGSVFHVRLRQRFVSDAPIGREVAAHLMEMRYTLAKRAKGTRLARADLSYAHVLVVDDIATNLDVAKGMMKAYGLKVDCASSGRQAVEMVRAESPRYRAVFMDHMMPGMDGVEATRIIREEIGTEYARDIPIIALTANAILGNEEMFIDNGFQGFISKPIDMAKLDAVLRRWVRDKALERERSGAERADGDPADEGGGGSPGRAPLIDGVDTSEALARFGGDEEVLLDVLRSYAANTRPLLNALREQLGAERLEDYAVTVHGIKGSSYGISAGEAGRAAEALETAAKAGDLDAVKKGHFAFEKIAEALLNNIVEALDDPGGAKPLRAGPASGEASPFTAPDAEILIVEDNETNRKAALGLLKPLRMRIDTAENGREALRMIREKEYHLILMDYKMPVMDGIEATEELRRTEGDYYRSVPVIALSANEAEDAEERFLRAGMNDFLRKPIDSRELRGKLRRWLPGGLLREAAPEEEAPPPDDLPVIEGIDSREGLRYSGTRELFVNLLGDFYKLIDMKSAKIEKCLADGLLRDVTIEVHALKNTARMIGAGALSEDFRRLERYGDEGDGDALERETPAVLARYRSYKPILRPFGETSDREKKPASGAEWIALLRRLASAMDGFDLDGADEAMRELETMQVPPACRAQMEELRACVADVAMEEVMKLAEAMIETIENH